MTKDDRVMPEEIVAGKGEFYAWKDVLGCIARVLLELAPTVREEEKATELERALAALFAGSKGV